MAKKVIQKLNDDWELSAPEEMTCATSRPSMVLSSS